MEEIFICPFCGRNDFKTIVGLKNHVRVCKNNPDRVDHPNKSKKLSDETKQKLSEAANKQWDDPAKRRKQSETTKRVWERPEYRQTQIEAQNRPEVKQKRRESAKKRYECPEERRKQSEITTKYYNETPGAREKTSESQKIAQNRPEVKQKIYNTKKKNNTFNTSKIEEQLKEYLTSHNINFKTQYKSDLYPFMCDFYFPDKDLYVEIQGFWSHGDEPYDSEDEYCIKQLETWKSKNSKFYDSAIHTWTIRDVKKRETAKINNLNWIEIFSCDLDECIEKISNKLLYNIANK